MTGINGDHHHLQWPHHLILCPKTVQIVIYYAHSWTWSLAHLNPIYCPGLAIKLLSRQEFIFLPNSLVGMRVAN